MAGPRATDPGVRLRTARESKGLSLKQVAEATKLSVRSIEAVEGGKLSSLPSGIYRRAMVRAIAIEVGLDANQVLREMCAAHPDHLPEPDTLASLVERTAPRHSSIGRVFAIVGALVPLVAGIGYFTWAERAQVETSSRPPVARRPAQAWRPEIVPAGGFLEPPPAVRRPVVLTLTISSRCYLHVMADGREVLSREMEAGERVPVELGDELIMSGDNAAAVQFSINGQGGRLLGTAGEPFDVRIGRDDYDTFLSRD